MSHSRARRFAATALLAGASALPLIGATATVASANGLPLLGNTPAGALLGGSRVLNTPLAADGPSGNVTAGTDTPAPGSSNPLQNVTGAVPNSQLPIGDNGLSGPANQLAPGLAGSGSSPLGALGGLA